MRPNEIADAIGKEVKVDCSLWMAEHLRPVLGKTATLIKQCKSGLLLLERDGRHFSIPMRCVIVSETAHA
jgi:hypothetical protein